MTVRQWWRRGAGRRRLRRKLLVFSAPVALVLVVLIAKALSVGMAGGSAVTAYTERDTAALRSAVGTLNVLNVIEPAKAYFAAGSLAVLDNRLEEADRLFSESLARAESTDACPARVNLELIRETLGDRAAAEFDAPTAVAHYRSARSVVEDAEPGCFAGNTDSDRLRQALRNDAVPRLDGKVTTVQVAPPPPPPGATTSPPPAVQSGAAPDDPDQPLRLDPGAGTPLDRLQQILRDAAARAGR